MEVVMISFEKLAKAALTGDDKRHEWLRKVLSSLKRMLIYMNAILDDLDAVNELEATNWTNDIRNRLHNIDDQLDYLYRVYSATNYDLTVPSWNPSSYFRTLKRRHFVAYQLPEIKALMTEVQELTNRVLARRGAVCRPELPPCRVRDNLNAHRLLPAVPRAGLKKPFCGKKLEVVGSAGFLKNQSVFCRDHPVFSEPSPVFRRPHSISIKSDLAGFAGLQRFFSRVKKPWPKSVTHPEPLSRSQQHTAQDIHTDEHVPSPSNLGVGNGSQTVTANGSLTCGPETSMAPHVSDLAGLSRVSLPGGNGFSAVTDQAVTANGPLTCRAVLSRVSLSGGNRSSIVTAQAVTANGPLMCGSESGMDSHVSDLAVLSRISLPGRNGSSAVTERVTEQIEVSAGTISPTDRLRQQQKRYSNYCLKTLLFMVTMFAAYLLSDSASFPVTKMLFAIALSSLFIVDAALYKKTEEKWCTALAYLSWFLLVLLSYILLLSFHKDYGYAILPVPLPIVAALIHNKLELGGRQTSTGNNEDRDILRMEERHGTGNDEARGIPLMEEGHGTDEARHILRMEEGHGTGNNNAADENASTREEEDEDLDHIFDLSSGIVTCGGFITMVLGHYMVGQVNAGVFFFFVTVVLGLYLMMVTTVREATLTRHAACLAMLLKALLVITFIAAV